MHIVGVHLSCQDKNRGFHVSLPCSHAQSLRAKGQCRQRLRAFPRGHLEAEHEQLPANARRSTSRVPAGHSTDERASPRRSVDARLGFGCSRSGRAGSPRDACRSRYRASPRSRRWPSPATDRDPERSVSVSRLGVSIPDPGMVAIGYESEESTDASAN